MLPSVAESAPSSVVVSKRQALRLSPAGLSSLLQQHGPALRSFEARALDLAAFQPASQAGMDVEAVGAAAESDVVAPSPSQLRKCLPPSLRALTMAARLTSIDLTGSKRLASGTVCELVSAQPQLQRLVLAGCAQLSDSALSTILEHCPALSSLSVARCRLLTPAAFSALHRSGVDERLRELDVSGLSKITATCLLDTVLSAPRPLLRSLRMAGVRGVTDGFLREVAAHCPNLQVLDVSAADPSGVMAALALRRDSAADVTLRGIEALAGAPCADSLRVLKLRGRAGVSAGKDGQARTASVKAAFTGLRVLDATCSPGALRMVGGAV
jgi:hypothetical protein